MLRKQVQMLGLLAAPVLVAAAAYGLNGSAVAQVSACPETLAHLASDLPRYSDPDLERVRQAALNENLNAAMSRAVAQGISPREAAMQAARSRDSLEQGKAQALQCFSDRYVGDVDRDQIVQQLESGTYRFRSVSEQNAMPSALEACAKSYVVFYYALKASRAAAVGLACHATRSPLASGVAGGADEARQVQSARAANAGIDSDQADAGSANNASSNQAAEAFCARATDHAGAGGAVNAELFSQVRRLCDSETVTQLRRQFVRTQMAASDERLSAREVAGERAGQASLIASRQAASAGSDTFMTDLLGMALTIHNGVEQGQAMARASAPQAPSGTIAPNVPMIAPNTQMFGSASSTTRSGYSSQCTHLPLCPTGSPGSADTCCPR